MAATDGPELLHEIFTIETDWRAADTQAAALEAEAKQLRAGWSDKRWQAMYTAALGLQQAWEGGELGLEDALTVSDEIVAREYGRDYMCGAAATAATIAAMQPGEPVYGRGSQFLSGIVAAPPVVTFSAHEKQSGIGNPTVLYTNLTAYIYRANSQAETVEDEITETTPYIKNVSDYYVVGREAIQAMLNQTGFSEGYERDYCGAHSSSYRTSNTRELRNLVDMTKAFATKGITFDTTKIREQIAEGATADREEARLDAVSRALRRRQTARRR